MEQGLIHLYTGDGKGKTSAAAGLAVRAAGAGQKVWFVQFMKGAETGELESFRRIPGITVLRSEKDFGFVWNMNEDQKLEMAAVHDQLLKEVLKAVEEERCDVLILDEITYPVAYGLIDTESVRRLVTGKPAGLELVMTGRNAADYMVQSADYITEMCCVRHPFEKGVAARRGIEY